MCEHGEGYVISHSSKCFSSTCASMMVHLFTVISRLSLVSSLIIDSVRAPFTDAQEITACSISDNAYYKRKGPTRQLESGYLRLDIAFVKMDKIHQYINCEQEIGNRSNP